MKLDLRLLADEHIRMALREDIGNGDVSTFSVLPEKRLARVQLICKQDGVIAGLWVFSRVFALLDPSVSVVFHVYEGDRVGTGQLLGSVEGDARVLLTGERTALNYLQRMSGIATYTRSMVDLLAGTGTKLVDTRKTTPGMRIFEKEAVRIGGGGNHRFNLSDCVMLKDNHIAAAGGIRQAVEAARVRSSFVHKVEVEAESLEMVEEALEAGADIIMLDNMTPEQVAEAIVLIGGRAQTECSGNVAIENAAALAGLGVDFISCGALTHSAGILDLSMKHFEMVDAL